MATPPPVQFATIGMWDTLLLMALALVVFGPRRLPMIGRQIGKLMYEFRKASNDFKFQMEEELRQSEEADRRRKEEEDRRRAPTAAPAAPELPQSSLPQAETPAATCESTYPYPSTEPMPAAPPILPPSSSETVAVDHPSAPSEIAIPEAEKTESAAHHG